MTQDFLQCKMEYKRDEQGKEVLLKDGKFQVMMEWEKPYMQACIDALNPFGDLLEVGFGLGFSAERIQSYHPKSHTLIEYHPVIAARARKWAERYPNVTVIEETWQHALPKLGKFDCIFFDDYPLQSEQEMQKMQEESQQSELLIKQAERLLKDVEKVFPHLSKIRYSDRDLQGLLQEIPLEQKDQVRQLVRFLKELCDCGQISEKQMRHLLNELVQEKKIAKEEIDILMKRSAKQALAETPNDRLFVFLKQCLASHLRNNGRFSCFLSSPVSKYQDEKFVSEIITNPHLDYHEEEISIEVPEHCAYFSGNKALVAVITLRQ